MCVSDEETFKVRDRRDSWTIPITQWFTHETPEAIEVRPIQSHWFRFRDKFINTNCDLPQGWTREKPEEILGADWRECGYYKPPPQGLGEYVYQQAAALDDEYFWLPVPIATGSQETDSPGPLQTPCISCNTKHGWFSAALFPKPYFSDSQLSRCPEYLTAVGLLNARGEYCGRLYLQGPDDILRFPEASSGRALRSSLLRSVSGGKSQLILIAGDPTAKTKKTYRMTSLKSSMVWPRALLARMNGRSIISKMFT